MNTDPTQDAHSLGIALRLAQAQNRELRRQLAETQSQQWQPIETAPELEWVLVPHEGRSVEARYELSNDGVMCWFQPRHNRSMEPKPTHWMPLPEPPMSDK